MWVITPKLKKEKGECFSKHFQQFLFQGKIKKKIPSMEGYSFIESMLEDTIHESYEVKKTNTFFKKKKKTFVFDGVIFDLSKKRNCLDDWDVFCKRIRERVNQQIRLQKTENWGTPRTGMAIAHKGGGDPFNQKAWFNRLENQIRYQQNWATPTAMLANNMKRSLESLVKKATSGGRKLRSFPGNLNEQMDDLSIFVYKKVCDYYRSEPEMKKKMNVLEYVALETKLFEKSNQPFDRQGLINPRWIEVLMGLSINHCKIKRNKK